MSDGGPSRFRTGLTVRLFADDWDGAQAISQEILDDITDTIIDDAWMTSLESFGPDHNQPWGIKPNDRDTPWGQDTRRFRAELYLGLTVDEYGELLNFVDSHGHVLEERNEIECAYFGSICPQYQEGDDGS